jgi:dipeptidyl aminopeptidase/acylaminoacyl peptidase
VNLRLASLSLGLVTAFLAMNAHAVPVLTGPPPRELTDPRKIFSPSKADVGPSPVADLFYVRGGMDGVWTRDGKSVVISTNLTGRYNLWKLTADGGFPLQLTQSDDRQSALATSPDGRWVVYQADHAGDEIYDLYAVSLNGGQAVDLTSTPLVSEQRPQFSPDGALLAFEHRLKTSPNTDVAVMDFATRKVRLLTHETAPDQEWSVVAFVEDGRRIIANRVNFAGTVGSVWSIDVASGAATPLTAPKGAYILASDATRDGKLVAMTAEQADGSRQAVLLDVAGKTTHALQPDPWEQHSGHFSPDGRTLMFSRNVDGRTSLSTYDVASGRIGEVALAYGVNQEASEDQTSFSPDGGRLLLTHQAGNTPMDYWVAELTGGKAEPITHLGLASINPARLPSADVVHYKSEDGTIISALLWTPFNLSRDGKAPAVVLPHGGPTGQTVDTFNRTAVALASRGYMVIAPNPRGSTGYGRAFEEANRKDLGGGDLVDEVYAAKFMAATGYADPKKIGITGGSYGGYMTLMAAAKTPTLWAAAVEEYGIIDWFQMYQHEAPTLQQYQIGLIGDPVKDRAVYTASSPLTYVHGLTAPLLVLQGDNDIRVPKGQAEEVIELLKKDGRTVDSHFYPNEGHGFVKRENQIDSLERTIVWFDKYLKPAP